MKQKTPSQKHPFQLMLLGMILTAIGIIAIILYGEFTTITLIRNDTGVVDCTKQIKWLGIIPLTQVKTLQDVTLAKVDTSCYTDSTSNDYECSDNILVIQNETEAFKLGSQFFNTATAAETKTRINDYIRHPDEKPLVIVGKNTISVVLGILFVALPFLILGNLLLWARK
ncbi:MAG: hypothetical protein CVU39_18055 [Chloroflexi bacterium HGW-Chloroflexi-10]|nr:MAG: hypothetical protein CVU39_18055 [Chloroflexi bacterium HGW-Chloroflexi-10]